jgi:threonylcarbamoyladenosine tRNA methylthiotransferase MtaB
MPQIAPEIGRARAARLREAGAAALARHLKAQIGRRIIVLAERGGKGRAEDFTPIRIPAAEPGTLIAGVVTGHDGRALLLRSSS